MVSANKRIEIEIRACIIILVLNTFFICSILPSLPNSNVKYLCVEVAIAPFKNVNIATIPPTTL